VGLEEITAEVVGCGKCPRLVRHREATAAHPPKRFRGEDHWGRPVPGFGDPRARLVVVGLAPAAHGGNRTGRFFTGDRSGDWLFRALHRAGFASQPTSTHRDDGLRLNDCYVTAVVRCAPPGNQPKAEERDNCLGYLVRELGALRRARAIVALGAFAWDGVLRALRLRDIELPSPKPKFGHLEEVDLGRYRLVGSYHPSQQNTFTGRLTEPAFDEVFRKAQGIVGTSE
jgi:uracil-DNA glycosylase family 4